MTDAERIAWGKQEHFNRLDDIASVKAGIMALEEIQKAARSRARASGMTPHQAHMALVDGQRAIATETNALSTSDRSEPK